MIKGSLVFLTLQEFLKKEFSEENILFWQACEFFSHVPETDKKQVRGFPAFPSAEAKLNTAVLHSAAAKLPHKAVN